MIADKNSTIAGEKMFKRISDKAKVARQYRNNFNLGPFGASAQFEAQWEEDGMSLASPHAASPEDEVGLLHVME
jgi:hypothetical protein